MPYLTLHVPALQKNSSQIVPLANELFTSASASAPASSHSLKFKPYSVPGSLFPPSTITISSINVHPDHQSLTLSVQGTRNSDWLQHQLRDSHRRAVIKHSVELEQAKTNRAQLESTENAASAPSEEKKLQENALIVRRLKLDLRNASNQNELEWKTGTDVTLMQEQRNIKLNFKTCYRFLGFEGQPILFLLQDVQNFPDFNRMKLVEVHSGYVNVAPQQPENLTPPPSFKISTIPDVTGTHIRNKPPHTVALPYSHPNYMTFELDPHTKTPVRVYVTYKFESVISVISTERATNGGYEIKEFKVSDPVAGIAVFSEGKENFLLVANKTKNNMQIYNLKTNKIYRSLPNESELQNMKRPTGLTVLPPDEFLVVDTGLKYLRHGSLNNQARLAPQISSKSAVLENIRDVAAYERQYAFVCDTGNHCIAVFEMQNGRFVLDTKNASCFIGKFGSKKSEFNAPARLCVFDGLLYVSDTGNARIQVFDATERPFRFVRQWRVSSPHYSEQTGLGVQEFFDESGHRQRQLWLLLNKVQRSANQKTCEFKGTISIYV